MRDAVMATLLPTPSGAPISVRRDERRDTCFVRLLDARQNGRAVRRRAIPGPTCGIVLGRRPVGGVHGRLRRRDHVHFRATGSSDRDETPGGHGYPSDLVARWNANLLSLGRPKFRRERHDISDVCVSWSDAGVKGGTYRQRSPQFQRDYDVTRDGKQFVGVIDGRTTDATASAMQELHVVLNWFAELKRLVPTE
jgi:hypothetical protein